MSTRTWAPVSIYLLIIALVFGCAAPQTMKVDTTEEAGAVDADSLAKIDSLLKVRKSFAYSRIQIKDWEMAREHLLEILKYEEYDKDNKFNIWKWLYESYRQTGDIDSAIAILDLGLERYPEDAYLTASKGFFLKLQGMKEEALPYFEISTRVEPDNVKNLITLGELYEALNRGEDAITTYERVIALSPGNMGISDRITTLIRRFRNPEEYIAKLESDVTAAPDDITKRLDLMTAYADQQMNDKIVAQADEILKLDSGNLEAFNRKALALENLNRLPEAIRTYQALLGKHPDNYQATLRIADDYRLLGEYVQARLWVKKVNTSGAPADEATYILGRVYEDAGDKCSGGVPKYDDKLTFIIALGLYQNAMKSSEYAVREMAERRLSALREFVPKYSDWFMNQSKTLPENGCYKWIKSGWQEVGYIAVFLKKIEESK